MVTELFNWLLDIPATIAQFGNWLVSPLKPGIIDLSPLGLLGVAGVSVIIALIVIHIVKLFL